MSVSEKRTFNFVPPIKISMHVERGREVECLFCENPFEAACTEMIQDEIQK